MFNVNYHIVWCVKYRKKVLTPQICDELYTIAHNIAKEKGFEIAEIKVGEQDHVHCFVYANCEILERYFRNPVIQ